MPVALFDVIGADGRQERFIAHSGIAARAGQEQTRAVRVIHMVPPMQVAGSAGTMPAAAVGSAELTVDEEWKIKTFLDRQENEHAPIQELRGRALLRAIPQMYCIFPHAVPLREADDRYTRTRYSCAGLVIEAYCAARIVLLELASLPMVSMDLVRGAYPGEVALMDRGAIVASALGLDGDGPWPIVLCGYLFHALGRDVTTLRESPYAPREGDWVF